MEGIFPFLSLLFKRRKAAHYYRYLASPENITQFSTEAVVYVLKIF